MEWQLTLLLILGSVIVLMAIGMPVAFAFLLVSIVGMFLLFGGETGLRLLIPSIRDSVAAFVLLPLSLFILMGEVMFQSKMAPLMLDALDKWLGRLPGRLGLLAVGAGTIFATLTTASMGSTAMLGALLVPDMEKRGYKKPMSLGPILGSGGLAIMIPPSGLAVLLGALAEISIGRILIAIVIPGLLMAALYATYIILRCRLQPSLAPSYEVPPIPLSEKLLATVKYILPLGFIVFLVVGVIIIGVATPTEAAATGAVGVFMLAAAYRKLSWDVVKKSMTGTVQITVMLFMIVVGATSFSQVLAASGAMRGAIAFALSVSLTPILILTAMWVMLIFMGMFMGVVAIMMITLPLFMPIIHGLCFDLVWFAVMYLITIEMAGTSPPFGLSLFVMKGVAPPDTTMGDIYRAGLPFLGCDAIAIALIMIFPAVALWLPGLVR